MRTVSTFTGLNKSWELRSNQSLSTLTKVYMSRRALSMNLQPKRPLSSQSSSSSNTPRLHLHHAILSMLLHVSQLPNSPFIKLMGSPSQDKMEAHQARPRRHDNILALRQQQLSGVRSLCPNDELEIERPLSLLVTPSSLFLAS